MAASWLSCAKKNTQDHDSTKKKLGDMVTQPYFGKENEIPHFASHYAPPAPHKREQFTQEHIVTLKINK